MPLIMCIDLASHDFNTIHNENAYIKLVSAHHFMLLQLLSTAASLWTVVNIMTVMNLMTNIINYLKISTRV